MAGVKPGKAVITTPITSPATNVSIIRLGGQIIWADVDKNSGNISPDSIEKLLNKYNGKIVAVIAVDWGGMPCDLDKINNIISNKCLLIEDAAHALGAKYKNKLIGNTADFTCFSFQAIKHITTGDGGLVTTKKKKDWHRASKLRWFGINRARPNRTYRDDITEAGFKFHMNDIASSIGLAQLEDLPKILKKRRQIGHYYEKELTNINFQKVSYSAESAYWLFTLRVPNREKVIKFLDKNQIDSSPLHCRNDIYTAFKNDHKDKLNNTKIFDQQMLSIPVGDWLTDSEVEHIVKTLKKL